jgi:hypothetical protein
MSGQAQDPTFVVFSRLHRKSAVLERQLTAEPAVIRL